MDLYINTDKQMKNTILIYLLFSSFSMASDLNINVELPDGSTYYGKIKNNKFNDTQGSLNWTNGAAYIGGFKNGLMNGIGKIRLANGSEYKGQFKNGMANGLGFLKFANGDFYKGSFKNDLFDGIGDLKYSNLGGGYYGDFKKDVYHGKGTLYFDFGDVISFKGNFVDGQPKIGTLTLVNGDVYNGEIDNALFPHGKGKYVFKNKDKKFKKGLFEHGILTNFNADKSKK